MKIRAPFELGVRELGNNGEIKIVSVFGRADKSWKYQGGFVVPLQEAVSDIDPLAPPILQEKQ